MTEREMNVAIAEACGWEYSPTNDHSSSRPFINHRLGLRCSYNGLNDYCNDLNAMHEAERFLWAEGKESYNPFIQREYLQELDRVTHDQWSTVSATAQQRAEAFLRTIGKWKE